MKMMKVKGGDRKKEEYKVIYISLYQSERFIYQKKNFEFVIMAYMEA